MQKKQKKGLVWFRNDLRVTDNRSLYLAQAECKEVIGIYCFDPRHFEITSYGFKKTERFRGRFLIESVSDLQDSLADLNISLIVKHDQPEIAIPAICLEHQPDVIYCQKEWTEEEVSVLQAVKEGLPSPVPVIETYDQFLYHPEDCPIAIPKIPRVFTAFRKKCEKLAEVRPQAASASSMPPENLLKERWVLPELADLGLTEFEADPRSAFPFRGGEGAALERIQHYFFETRKLGVYKKTRNGLLGTDYSSKLSAWLSCGCISPRQVYWAVKDFESQWYKNQSTYWLIFELIWRDFFKYISLRHGNDIFKIGGILNKEYHWEGTIKDFNAWTEGQTSEPFVNANMIELKETGWMSNRGRQNTASYLAKDLKVDWRLGAAWFESLLVDYDVHSNYGNWMYVAGVGNDPRDRKFNVQLQAQRYDPQGKFQNRWLQKTLF